MTAVSISQKTLKDLFFVEKKSYGSFNFSNCHMFFNFSIKIGISSVVSYHWVKDGNSKKISVKEKEAYASSFEIVVLICDFLTHGVSNGPFTTFSQ